MHNNQKQSQSSLNSEKAYSNNTFRTNSNKYLHQEFDKAELREVECHFCHSKHIILEQLEMLRQAVEAKNERIRELEGFIQKISKMAFTTSTDTNQTNFAFEDKQQPYAHHQQDLTFAHRAPERSEFKGIISRDMSKSSLNNLSRSNSSSIVSEISANEKENIKNSIKREIKKMTLDKVEAKQNLVQKSSPSFSRQSTLKNKLLEIINVLPSNDSSSNLQSFQTESEPFQEGHAGIVNAKVSNHKIVKHSGFLKKGETVSEDSMKSTLKSDTLKKIREATQQMV